MTGVLRTRGNLDMDIDHTQRTSCEEQGRDWGHASTHTKGCQQPTESEGRGTEQMLPHSLGRNQPCRRQTSGLQSWENTFLSFQPPSLRYLVAAWRKLRRTPIITFVGSQDLQILGKESTGRGQGQSVFHGRLQVYQICRFLRSLAFFCVSRPCKAITTPLLLWLRREPGSIFCAGDQGQED